MLCLPIEIIVEIFDALLHLVPFGRPAIRVPGFSQHDLPPQQNLNEKQKENKCECEIKSKKMYVLGELFENSKWKDVSQID